jgi:hypothetical protein
MDLEKEVEELKEKLSVYENSPYVDAYLGVIKHIGACNKDLIDTPAGLRDEEDMKAFEKFEKYILKIDEYYNKLQYLRDKMNPQEIKEVDAKVAKSKTVAI